MVREYNEEDYLIVDDILFRSLGYHKEKIGNPQIHEFVACCDEQVVGYFNCVEVLDIIRNLKTLHIDYLCVDEVYRRRGFGREMVEFAIEFAKKNQVSRLELTSSNYREAAHGLYLSLGFEKRDSSIFRKEIL